MVDGIENIIISLYAKGMSNSDIEEQISELYGFDVSTSTISRITDKVSGDIVAWQNRPLEAVYLIVWMDGIGQLGIQIIINGYCIKVFTSYIFMQKQEYLEIHFENILLSLGLEVYSFNKIATAYDFKLLVFL